MAVKHNYQKSVVKTIVPEHRTNQLEISLFKNTYNCLHLLCLKLGG